MLLDLFIREGNDWIWVLAFLLPFVLVGGVIGLAVVLLRRAATRPSPTRLDKIGLLVLLLFLATLASTLIR